MENYKQLIWKNKLLTNESVSNGHPDKVCDQIADAILDDALKIDPFSHVGCEVFACKNTIVVGGEICLQHKKNINITKIIKKQLMRINYTNDINIDINKLKINNIIQKQSFELQKIMHSRSKNHLFSTYDQGIVTGYACNYFNKYINDYMPIGHSLANFILKFANKIRTNNIINFILPDMKIETVISVNSKNKNVQIEKLFLSVQHKHGISLNKLKDSVINKIIYPCLSKTKLINKINRNNIFINPAGNFCNGGWISDTGTTGRKLVCDFYGNNIAIGGGALSGKDGTKVDRFAAYYARYIAKNIVAAKLCDEIWIQISYSIGASKVLAINVNTFGTAKKYNFTNQKIRKIILKEFNFNPNYIFKKLKLNKIKYLPLATFGHFGFNAKKYLWENIEFSKILNKKYINN